MTQFQLKQLCSEILEEGRKRYSLMMGIVSRISDDTYDIFAVSSETKIPEPGDKYPLDSVYCREVFEKKKTVSINEINGVLGMSLHPLYDFIPCEVYISSPIIIDNNVWGTLNFTSLEKRGEPFTLEDIAFNEKQAARISSAVAVAKLY